MHQARGYEIVARSTVRILNGRNRRVRVRICRDRIRQCEINHCSLLKIKECPRFLCVANAQWPWSLRVRVAWQENNGKMAPGKRTEGGRGRITAKSEAKWNIA